MKTKVTITLLILTIVTLNCKTKIKNDLPGKNWMNKYDIDGDGQNDEIDYSYSGGAHCCYKISVLLTKNKKRYNFPFQMDGGYIGGLDLSDKNNFSIKDYDNDGLPEIFMKIISKSWTKEYGIKSNYIVIEYANNRLIVWDIPLSTSIEQYFFSLKNKKSIKNIYLKKENGKFSYTDDKNTLIILDKFDEAYNFSEGIALVKFNDQYVFINTSGKIVSVISKGLETHPMDKIFPSQSPGMIIQVHNFRLVPDPANDTVP